MDRFKLLRKIFTVIKRNYRGGTSDATSKTLFNAIFSDLPKTKIIHVKKEPVGTDGQTDGHDLLQSCLPRSRVEKTNFSRVQGFSSERAHYWTLLFPNDKQYEKNENSSM